MNYSRYIPIISIVGDFIILNAILVFGFIIYDGTTESLSSQYLAFYAYLNIIWFILVFAFKAHTIDRNIKKKSIVLTYINIIVFFFFLFMLYSQISVFPYYPRKSYKYIFPAFFAILITWKMLLYYALFYYRKHGFNFRNVIVLGYTPGTRELEQYFRTNQWHGYRFLGFFDEKVNEEQRIIGTWSELKPFIDKTHVDEIYLAWSGIPQEKMPEITNLLAEYPVKIRIVPNLGDFTYKSAELVNFGVLPVIQIHPGPLSYLYNRIIKRLFDIFVSLIFIILVLPWMTAALYLSSLFGSREGVFFRQNRTSINGKVFTCLKYRSMRRNPDADLKQATRMDQRITPVGKILRKLSIDELPQFINVLLGEMSVVGPRPHMLEHTEQYRKVVKRFMLRHTVKPGLTGLAQVNGYRGEIKEVDDIRKRVEMDVHYIENWSFGLDVKIIFRTLWVVIRGQEQAY